MYPVPDMPAGRAVVDMTRVELPPLIASCKVFVAVSFGRVLSATWNPMLNVPDADGVPLKTPFAFSESPTGRAVVADHV